MAAIHQKTLQWAGLNRKLAITQVVFEQSRSINQSSLSGDFPHHVLNVHTKFRSNPLQGGQMAALWALSYWNAACSVGWVSLLLQTELNLLKWLYQLCEAGNPVVAACAFCGLLSCLLLLAVKGLEPANCRLRLYLLFVFCHCGSNSLELEQAGNMKLGPTTGNDVQMLPKKHERNWPDGGAVVHVQKCNFGKATVLTPWLRLTWNLTRMSSSMCSTKQASSSMKGLPDGFFY